MAALGALLIQAAWSTMAGRPLALAAFNAFFTFGTAFGLDIHLNFFDRALAAAPTFSPKDIVLNGFYGASSLSSRDDVSLSKALVTVLFPAAASVIEPFWFTRDQNSSIVFGPCQLSGPGSSVGSSSSALPVSQDSSGGPAGCRGCSRDGNDRRAYYASGDRQGHGGGNNGRNGGHPPPPPPPTGSVHGAPDATSDPPRPIAGGTPPPPPPPSGPGMGGLWQNRGNDHRGRLFHIVCLILAGFALRVMLRGFTYAACNSVASRDHGDRVQGYRTMTRAIGLVTLVPNKVRWAVNELAGTPSSTSYMPLALRTPVDSGLEPCDEAMVAIVSRIFGFVYGLLTMSAPARLFWVMVIGLFVYYHMLVQAARIVHFGYEINTVKDRPESPKTSRTAEDTSCVLEESSGAVDVEVEGDKVEATLPATVGEVSTREDVVRDNDTEAQGLYASMHCPVQAVEASSSSSPSSSLSSGPVPSKPVEHIGGIPITECEIRAGGRERRRTRCRKKKASISSSAPIPSIADHSDALELAGSENETQAPMVESESKPVTFIQAEDDDSRGLKSSMWAS